MGMFDYISIESKVNLPIPENFDLNLKTFEFQTKSLDNAMLLYTIANDGFLYQENYIEPVKTTEKNIIVGKPLRKKVDFHGVIEFGAYHSTDTIDYSLEYEAKFTDGALQSIKLLSYDKYEHKSRSESIKDLLDKVEQTKKRFAYRFPLLLQYIFVVCPLKIFGLHFESRGIGKITSTEYTIMFYRPVFLKERLTLDEINGYSITLETNNHLSYRKYKSGKFFAIKLLGFGFSINSYKYDAIGL